MKKSRKVLIIILVALILTAGTFAIIKLSNKKEDTVINAVKDNLVFEINEEVTNKDLLLEGFNAISEEKIDTSKLGEFEYTIKYSTAKEELEEVIKYKVIDTKAPELTCEEKLEITAGDTIDLASKAKVIDNSKEEIEIKIEGEYDINKAGEYQLKYVVEDSSKNKTEKEFKLVVKEKPVEVKQENKTSNNNSKSNNNKQSQSNQNSQPTQPSQPTQNTSCSTLPLYTFVSRETWQSDSCNHIRQITYYWYVNYIERDENGVVNYVEWGVSCDSGSGMPAVEAAKSHMPAPPTGQTAVDMYNSNNKVHYGNTVLYTVIP